MGKCVMFDTRTDMQPDDGCVVPRTNKRRMAMNTNKYFICYLIQLNFKFEEHFAIAILTWFDERDFSFMSGADKFTYKTLYRKWNT